jgi:hypothetical protein
MQLDVPLPVGLCMPGFYSALADGIPTGFTTLAVGHKCAACPTAGSLYKLNSFDR